MAQFWPQKTSSRIAMVGCWVLLAFFGYHEFVGPSQSLPSLPAKPQSASTPDEIRANRNDVGRYGEELNTIEMAGFGVYCNKVNPIIANKDTYVMMEEMVHIANPGVPQNVSDPTMDQKIADAKIRGKERAPSQCAWWDTEGGKAEAKRLWDLARFYSSGL